MILVIYTLVLKGIMDIQGVIAMKNDMDANAVYVHWTCSAMHNNVWEYCTQKYSGAGGHLLAVAAQKSVE